MAISSISSSSASKGESTGSGITGERTSDDGSEHSTTISGSPKSIGSRISLGTGSGPGSASTSSPNSSSNASKGEIVPPSSSSQGLSSNPGGFSAISSADASKVSATGSGATSLVASTSSGNSRVSKLSSTGTSSGNSATTISSTWMASLSSTLIRSSPGCAEDIIVTGTAAIPASRRAARSRAMARSDRAGCGGGGVGSWERISRKRSSSRGPIERAFWRTSPAGRETSATATRMKRLTISLR